MRARWLLHALVKNSLLALVPAPGFSQQPGLLNEGQQKGWLRRQRLAETALAVQALSGTLPNEETIGGFQRYVRGGITLARAIGRVREQMAQEHAVFRQCLNRGGGVA